MEVKTEVAGEKTSIFMGYRISGGGMNIVFNVSVIEIRSGHFNTKIRLNSLQTPD